MFQGRPMMTPLHSVAVKTGLASVVVPRTEMTGSRCNQDVRQ
jgi:hypothetical protein